MQVFRVKHKLDGTEYAIKKIFIRSAGIKAVREYLSEVKTFASLNHSNIVQYKAAWLELGAATSRNAISDQSQSDLTYTHNSNTDDLIEEPADDYIYPNAISETEITFAIPPNSNGSSEFEVNFENTSTKHYSQSSNNALKINARSFQRTREKRNSISEGGNAICKIEEIKNLHDKVKHHTKWATLYIQMSLCQSTLKQWLEKRNENSCNNSIIVPCTLNKVQTETVMEILKQLLRGIEYIHSKNIVHHDIKPSNIFIQIENGRWLVQLGDFGLACPLQNAKHSLAFGTKLYAAPEQLSGKCDPKVYFSIHCTYFDDNEFLLQSDMYSLGIVLLELVESFKTEMERIKSITELRKGNMPTHLPVQQPQIASIIGKLVRRHPIVRPDAATLLQDITLNVNESELVQELRNKLLEKDDEILRLKTMLKNAGIKEV